MPAIKLKGINHSYSLQTEISAIKAHQNLREIPVKEDEKILLASWNLCNLGDKGQVRSDDSLRIMAEILKPFDLIAVQEVKDNYHPFRQLVSLMGDNFDFIMTDKAGNQERLAYIYDTNTVQRTQLVGELVIPDREKSHPTLLKRGKKVKCEFKGFNRNPFLASFRKDQFDFTLVNVHIYYGNQSSKYPHRVAEVYNLARWAKKRVTKYSDYTYDKDIILIGDFNLNKGFENDLVGRSMIRYGMQVTDFPAKLGTNLSGKDDYDQLAFNPNITSNRLLKPIQAFDYDNAVFRHVWQDDPEHFRNYAAHHISDHRLIWSQWDSSFVAD